MNPGTRSRDDDGALAQAGALIATLRDTAGRYLDLFTAELRQAGRSISMMLALAIVLSVLVTGAWGLLCAAVAVGVWSAGFSLAACLLVLALINAIGAFAVVMAISSFSRGLTFTATRRSLEKNEEGSDASATARQ